MKKIIIALVVIGCLLTAGAGNALAKPQVYDNIEDFLTKHPEYKSKVATLVTNPDAAFTRFPENMHAATIVQGEYTEFTGWKLGWYNATNPSDKTELISDFKTMSAVSFKVGVSNFGLYIEDPEGNYYYSQAKLNGGDVDAKVYQINEVNGHRYLVAFDDRQPTFEGKYLDVVVDLHPVGISNIPEFPTIALPIAAMLGLMFIFGRRKEE